MPKSVRFHGEFGDFRVDTVKDGASAEDVKVAGQNDASGQAVGFTMVAWLIFLLVAGKKVGNPLPNGYTFNDAAASAAIDPDGVLNVWVERKPMVARTEGATAIAGAGADEPRTFEQLLVESGLLPAHIHAPTVLRASIKYGHVVTLALMQRSSALAREAYELAKLLPSTSTVAGLRVEGYKLNGLLYEGSELVVCYQGERVHLLKGLRDDEAARARVFCDACDGERMPHITPYELITSTGGKHYMLMPKYATTLEPLPHLSPEGIGVLWTQLREALDGLHARGFAHADVKPSNICITHDGSEFFLIDLGSVARMGEHTSSTPAYVPSDLAHGGCASAALDWWMLAVTLAEKACGAELGLDVGGTHHTSMHDVRSHLRAHLATAVWAELEPLLAL